MPDTRELNRLFVAVTLLVGFSVFSITWELAAPADAARVPPSGLASRWHALAPLVPLACLGLLWAGYRRWRAAGAWQQDLGNIISSIHPVALIVVAPDRTIRMCNPALSEVFGYRAAEVLHRKTDLLYEDRRAEPGKPREVFDALEAHGFHVGMAVGRRKSGETFPLEIITASLSGKAGAVLLLRDITERSQQEQEMLRQRDRLEGLVHNRTNRLVATLNSLLREIAERKRAEETARRLNEELEERVQERTRDLERAYDELKQIDRLKDDFLSTVSHEFRTPLTSIMSFSEILLNFPEENPDTKREFQSIIYSESQRLSRLINDLLDLSKIQAGKMEWNFRPVDARQLVRRAVLSLRSLIEEKNLRLEQEVEPGLPGFVGDEDRMLQVLINLLGNAIKFTPAGRRVVVRARRADPGAGTGSGPRILFSVEDTGKGILPKDLDRIFERFSQCADDTTKKPQGTGLGLSICRKIVDAHRGRIWAESVYEQGSTFHVALPMAPRPAAAPEPAAGEAASPPGG